MDRKKKRLLCRLCYHETTDTAEIFGEEGKQMNYEEKINKYLYLRVAIDDLYPKTICWMCSQQLETFHKFFEKINETQKSMLEDDYERMVLHPTIQKSETAETTQLLASPTDGEDDSMVELIYVSNDYYGLDQEGVDIDNDVEVDSCIQDVLSEENIQSEMQGEHSVHENIRNRAVYIESTPEPSSSNEVIETDLICEENNFDAPDESTPIRQTRSRRKVTVAAASEVTGSRSRKTIATRKAKTVKKQNVECPPMHPKRTRGKCEKRKRTKKKTVDVDGQDDTMDSDKSEDDDDFPARDSDNEDWPAQETLDAFPKEILKDGLLTIKGKQLMSIINKFYKLECESCTEKPRFKHLKDLLDHYTSVHNEVGHVTCCQSKLSRYPAIIMHMARHIQPEPFRCDECGYMVTRPRFLERHKQTHLPEDQKPYACEQCPRRFCWKGALQIHLISHQPADERTLYVCHICGKVYDTPGGLSTHKKMIHSGNHKKESNVCHVCAKIFATRTGLHEHMSTIHQPREKDQLQCTECGKWLMNYRCLKSHMILHSDVKEYCNICEYSTKKKVLLKRHMLTQHSDEKPFKCHLCDKSFKLKRALSVHVASHGATKTYQCPFCERVFNSSTNYYTHRKSIHPKEWQEMKIREEEALREKRIAAGIEEGGLGTATETDSNYVLATESEEITIIKLGEEVDSNISIIGANEGSRTIVSRYSSSQSSSQPIIFEVTNITEANTLN